MEVLDSKPVDSSQSVQVNCDPETAQIQRMKSQIEQLQSDSELLFYRGDMGAPCEKLQILKHKVSVLEASNAELKVEKDKLVMKIKSAQNGISWDEIDSISEKDYDLVQNYVSKIQELEAELLHLRNTNGSKINRFYDCMDTDDDKEVCKNVLFPPSDYASDFEPKFGDFSDEIEDQEKELENYCLQEKYHKELKELDKKLELKEAEMKLLGDEMKLLGDASSVLEEKVLELGIEKQNLLLNFLLSKLSS